MTNSNRAVMRGPSFGPIVHKAFGSRAEFIATVGIADFKNGPWHGLALGNLQQDRSIAMLDHGKECYWSEEKKQTPTFLW